MIHLYLPQLGFCWRVVEVVGGAPPIGDGGYEVAPGRWVGVVVVSFCEWFLECDFVGLEASFWHGGGGEWACWSVEAFRRLL